MGAPFGGGVRQREKRNAPLKSGVRQREKGRIFEPRRAQLEKADAFPRCRAFAL